MPRKTLLERLTEKSVLNEATGCLEWKGGVCEKGHGRIYANGRDTYVHRVAMEIKLGRKLESHEVVMHKVCDNPPCWNPNHLQVGTVLENLQDSIDKGRHNPHVRKKRRKNLSPEQVLVIKLRLSMGHGCRSISKSYGVSESSIRDIKNGRTYVKLKLGRKP